MEGGYSFRGRRVIKVVFFRSGHGNWRKFGQHHLTYTGQVVDYPCCPANGCSSCLWLQYFSGFHLYRLLHLASTKFN